MKSIRRVLWVVGMVLLAPLLYGQTAQSDSATAPIALTAADAASLKTLTPEQLQALDKALEATPPTSFDALPYGGRLGIFYSLAHPEWPPLPGDAAKIPVWSLSPDSTAPSTSAMASSSATTTSAASGDYLLDDIDFPPPPGGGTNSGGGIIAFDDVVNFTTNDLWLQIITVTNNTASLVIHPPWNVTNSMYDLIYCTNLDAPIAWQWLLRSQAGVTNLIVPNATGIQGYYALARPSDLTNNSTGTNFWFGFLNQFRGTTPHFSVYISSTLAATGTVTIPLLGFTNTFTVLPNTTTNIAVSSGIAMASFDAIDTNGIQVIASQPVSVVAFDYDPSAASVSFNALPNPLLGTNYCIMSYPAYYIAQSVFAIVATADDTVVTIAPSATAVLENHSGPYNETLQAGQTYQNQGGDVTGTMITSTKPIAVIAGDNLADVIAGHDEAANPLAQEQLPIVDWGTQALSWSFAGREIGDAYRVLAAYTNTVIFTNGVVAGTNQAGQSLDMEIYGPVEFTGTQPIQVSHMANGTEYDNQTGDPCEILLPPLGHYLQINTVVTPVDLVGGTNYWPKNYMTLIVPQTATTNTAVDGSLLASTNFASMGTNGYSGARISVTGGTHIVTSSQPVWVEVYGFANSDAYGYFGGVVQ